MSAASAMIGVCTFSIVERRRLQCKLYRISIREISTLAVGTSPTPTCWLLAALTASSTSSTFAGKRAWYSRPWTITRTTSSASNGPRTPPTLTTLQLVQRATRLPSGTFGFLHKRDPYNLWLLLLDPPKPEMPRGPQAPQVAKQHESLPNSSSATPDTFKASLPSPGTTTIPGSSPPLASPCSCGGSTSLSTPMLTKCWRICKRLASNRLRREEDECLNLCVAIG